MQRKLLCISGNKSLALNLEWCTRGTRQARSDARSDTRAAIAGAVRHVRCHVKSAINKLAKMITFDKSSQILPKMSVI